MVVTTRTAWAMLAGAVLLVWWPTAASVVLWALTVTALVALDVALAASPRRLVLERATPAQVRLGEVTHSDVLVTNHGRRGVRGLLRDAWPPSTGASPDRHSLRVPAGERVRVRTPLRPTRRGDRVADRVTVRTFGPLGLAGRQRSTAVPGTVRVLHPFPSRRHLPSRLSRLREIDGRSAVRRRGQGTEFDSLRDYVEGDDVRSIDWRATARRSSVVVRTWQPEQHRHVVIVVDTSRTSAGRVGDVPRLDAAMDAALLLTALASRAHDRVDVIAGDQVVRVRVGGSAERGTLLADVVSALAPVDAALVETDWTALVSGLIGRGHRRALVVLLTPLEPAAVEEGLLPVLPALVRRHRVVVASVSDPAVTALRLARETVQDAYGAAAAERTVTQRRRVAEALERLGVDVIDADADTLPPRLADHYLRLKSEGLL
ncbi:DUF58 domain-containing protein [Terrabacter aerolatus]|uniref:Lipoprotein n=1 Tax=Terrabacter aerolatus TaxID=422442 RepID=A0A512D6X0_9MICO|nr:DUF58 domain-containing protein [Terrabacter aerolatus]GEO32226.1 lipoprotein [Terrabacter aerolatus]